VKTAQSEMGRVSASLPLVVNIALPFVIYHFAAPHLGESGGLVLSSVPAVLWSLLEIMRFRRLDAISLLVLLGIFLSLGAMAVGGSVRFLLLREVESLVRSPAQDCRSTTNGLIARRWGSNLRSFENERCHSLLRNVTIAAITWSGASSISQ
jgi:uncharacterized protein involved in cysteine biosynthesis